MYYCKKTDYTYYFTSAFMNICFFLSLEYQLDEKNEVSEYKGYLLCMQVLRCTLYITFWREVYYVYTTYSCSRCTLYTTYSSRVALGLHYLLQQFSSRCILPTPLQVYLLQQYSSGCILPTPEVYQQLFTTYSGSVVVGVCYLLKKYSSRYEYMYTTYSSSVVVAVQCILPTPEVKQQVYTTYSGSVVVGVYYLLQQYSSRYTLSTRQCSSRCILPITYSSSKYLLPTPAISIVGVDSSPWRSRTTPPLVLGSSTRVVD